MATDSKRYWIRDEFDGGWGEYDTRAEAEAALLELSKESDFYQFRIDDMED